MAARQVWVKPSGLYWLVLPAGLSFYFSSHSHHGGQLTGEFLSLSTIWSGSSPPHPDWQKPTTGNEDCSHNWRAHILAPITEDFSFIEIAMKLYPRLPGINVSLTRLRDLLRIHNSQTFTSPAWCRWWRWWRWWRWRGPWQCGAAALSLSLSGRPSSRLSSATSDLLLCLWQFERSLHCSEGKYFKLSRFVMKWA